MSGLTYGGSPVPFTNKIQKNLIDVEMIISESRHDLWAQVVKIVVEIV